MKLHSNAKRPEGAARNDAEFAAACVAELVLAGLLAPTGEVMRRAARALTINVSLIVDAYTARRTGAEAWAPIDVEAPALEVVPDGRVMMVAPPRRAGRRTPVGGKGRTSERIIQGEGGTVERVKRCARCREWKPIEQFAVKDKLSDRRISYCSPCKVEYGRERYLTVRKLAALDRAGLSFAVVRNDLLLEMRCAECGEFFRPGDVVCGEIDLVHARHRDPVRDHVPYDLLAVEE